MCRFIIALHFPPDKQNLPFPVMLQSIFTYIFTNETFRGKPMKPSFSSRLKDFLQGAFSPVRLGLLLLIASYFAGTGIGWLSRHPSFFSFFPWNMESSVSSPADTSSTDTSSTDTPVSTGLTSLSCAIPSLTAPSEGNWGLSFQQDGQLPTGNATIESLKKYDAYYAKDTDEKVIFLTFDAGESAKVVKISPQAEADIKFGYCTEFIILLNQPMSEETEHEFKKFLMSLGDSIVLVADDEIVKVHVHTNHPGQAIEKALTFGALSRMKIDNMREEHQEKLIKDAEKMAKEQAEQEEKEEAAQPPKEVGFISVSVGKGMTEIFKELGVDYLIEGGQTMNPSTEDMLNAIAKVNAKTIYIFPNNKNIVLTANQARDLTEDKEIVVVPTKTIPQGITAMISYVPEKNSAENTEAMLQAIEHVKTGQITYAVRDTRIDDKEIHEGDMMGIGDHGILAVGKDRMEVAKETVAQMVDDESEVISIYYGADTEEAEAEELATALEEAYPDCDVELNAGGQPIYYYVISVE